MSLKAKVVLILISTYSIMYLFGYKILISSTESLPYTLFLQTPKKEFTTGTIVTFKYQFKNYFKYTQGDNFTKIIGCTQGQTILKIKNDFYCNGGKIGTALTKDGKGNFIESVEFNEIVPQGKYFMIGTNPKSYDSRYFGYVDEKDILGVTYGIL
jgi:conjugal transfer pilin signal peptidase TrbI